MVREYLTRCPNVDCVNTQSMEVVRGRARNKVVNLDMKCPTCGLELVHQFQYFSTSIVGWKKETDK